jgi:ABC-type branched-subunit amino acid transport system substrate-binding protein
VTSVVGNATADHTTSVATTRAAVRAINAAGGINGRPLQIVFCDNGYDAGKSAACAREFVSKGVVAMTASSAPFGEDVIANVLHAAGIPQVGDNGIAQWTTSANEFPVTQYLPGVYADIPACNQLGLKTIAITGTDNSFGQGFATILRGVATKFPDEKVVPAADRVIIPVTATDVSTQVRQVLDLIGNNPACIDMSGVYPQQQILFLNGLKTFNANPSKIKVLWGLASSTPQVLQQVGPLVQDYLIAISSFPPLSEQSKYTTLHQYVEEVTADKAAGDTGLPNVSGDTVQNDADIQAWLSVHALATVMQQQKAYTAKDITTAMLGATNVDIGDLTPAWTPTAKGGKAFLRLPVYTYFALGFNGQAEPHLALPTPIDIRPYTP